MSQKCKSSEKWLKQKWNLGTTHWCKMWSPLGEGSENVSVRDLSLGNIRGWCMWFFFWKPLPFKISRNQA